LDIKEVPKNELPDFDLFCGGFPCQSYSVAGPKSSKGIEESKKGILWWSIRATLEAKNPSLVLLENVDRLIKSPASQRGRDFGVMLKCFDELDYNVQWRIINAAEYGKPQKRRRIFIFAYKKDSNYTKEKADFFNTMFPCEHEGPIKESNFLLEHDISQISESFAFPFENSGSLINGHIKTQKAIVIPSNNERTLGNLLMPAPDNTFDIPDDKLESWKYSKGSKRVQRTTKEGYTYYFSEGACPYPDNLDIPARTMLTSEGSINRSSHVVNDPVTHKERTLLPIETERIQTFPDDWTKHGLKILANGKKEITTLTNRQRYFLMGNALVTELITDMASEIIRIYKNEHK
jgi:DNA (cytosine-5)-methyltransferase 1